MLGREWLALTVQQWVNRPGRCFGADDEDSNPGRQTPTNRVLKMRPFFRRALCELSDDLLVFLVYSVPSLPTTTNK